jgi:hypothetical protein
MNPENPDQSTNQQPSYNTPSPDVLPTGVTTEQNPINPQLTVPPVPQEIPKPKSKLLLILIILLALIGTGFLGFLIYQKYIVNNQISTPSPEATILSSPSNNEGSPIPTSTPRPTMTSAATSKPTNTPKPATPKPTITSTPIPTASCNYNLNEASGAVQFTFVPTKGSTLYWSTIAEIKALNGCNVLDGRSTDVIQRTKSSTSSTLNIPSIPAGTYEVRYSYHDNWGSSQTVSISSGQQTDVTFTVDNSSDP